MKYFEDIFVLQYCQKRRNIVLLSLGETKIGLIKQAQGDKYLIKLP